MARQRPILNVTRLRGRQGEDPIAFEVLLLGPDPSAPWPTYSVRFTVDPGGASVELDVDALLRALTPTPPTAA